ncbi:MAG: SMP-30/gluconolactonase/LRE family protein [Planctomycetota bacterium]
MLSNRLPKSCVVLLVFLVLCEFSVAGEHGSVGEIVFDSNELETVVDRDTHIEVLSKGFTWTEGPVWVGGDSPDAYLLFSDIPRNTIFRWHPDSGVTTYMNPSGYTGVEYYGLEPGSNGLTLDSSGRLTMCEHGDRRISFLSKLGGKRTLVDQFDGKRLNSPNDLTFDDDGNLYFTDPPYGLPNRFDDPRRELDFCGVYRLRPSGELQLLTKQLDRPNGIGLSPDGQTLYVAQSDPSNPIWMAFDLSEEGVGPGKVLMNASEFMNQHPGLPDGLDVHSNGWIFASGPGGIYVINPSNSSLVGRFVIGGRVSNCTLTPDQKFLYITADDKLCRVRLK